MSEFKKDNVMIFKVKDFSNARNKGARCDQSSKAIATNILKEIFLLGEVQEHYVRFENATRIHICVIQELYLRYFNNITKNSKVWFVTPLDAIMHELDK